jgi:hypothetical protein
MLNLANGHLAVDGQTLRGLREQEALVHMNQTRFVLAPLPVDRKTNEINIIPD